MLGADVMRVRPIAPSAPAYSATLHAVGTAPARRVLFACRAIVSSLRVHRLRITLSIRVRFSFTTGV